MPSCARKPIGGNQRIVDENAARDDRYVVTFPEHLRLADFERRFVGRDHGRFLAAEPQIDRPPHLGERDRRFFRLHGIARNDDRHVRNDAHDGDVFDRLMRRAVGTDRDAGVRARDLDVGFVERHDRAHLLPRTPGIEHRVARDPRNLSHRREAAGHRDEHLLGDADLDVLLRMRLLKAFESRRFGKIGTDAEHVAIARSGLDQSLAEPVARRNLLEVGGAIVRPNACAARRRQGPAFR